MFGFVCVCLFVLETYSLARSVFEKTPPNKALSSSNKNTSSLGMHTDMTRCIRLLPQVVVRYFDTTCTGVTHHGDTRRYLVKKVAVT